VEAVYSGLAIDVERHVLYFSDEGQGQIAELQLTSTTDVKKRILHSTTDSRPRSLAIDIVNRWHMHAHNAFQFNDNDCFKISRQLQILSSIMFQSYRKRDRRLIESGPPAKM